ncbi:G-protein coupled receptor 61-like [Hyla sarda]|uniref:G-protein coupled receptor 61-like n=1 Tax=Hyla sarda TaxID=327740 RepID=UPI0024C45952|nr:G-protein coupled receptor 61-like [Hyla sarda]
MLRGSEVEMTDASNGRSLLYWIAPLVTGPGMEDPCGNGSGNCSSGSLAASSPAAEGTIPRYVGLLLMLLLDVVAVAGNVAVTAVILKTPRLRKFLFVVHLCIVDTLAAVTVMPLGMVGSWGRVAFGESLCQAYISLEVCLSSASILTVSAINIERYYYIVHPMRYEVKMTLGLAISVLVFIWFQACLTSTVPFLSHHVGNGSLVNATRCSLQRNAGGHKKVFVTFFVLVYFVLPLVIILTVYCNVFKVARIAAMQHGPLPSWAASPRQRSNSTGSQTNIVPGHRSHRGSPDRTLGGAKAAFTLMIISGQFIMCWFPYFVYHVHNALGNGSYKGSAGSKWENIVKWLAYTSFAVNPFFYGCLNRQIRSELARIPKCFLKQSLDEQLGLSSHEGSVEENFLQFLQRTSCAVERRNSFPTSSTSRLLVNQSTLSFRIPGQILEETPELLEHDSSERFKSLQMCPRQGNSIGAAK